MQAMANVYRNLGETDKHRELVEEALRLVPDDRSGEPQPVVADNLVLLGHLAVGNREFDVARGHYERALEIRLAALGRDHPDVANSLNDLGNIVWAFGDYTEAMRLHGEALDIREHTLGPDNSDTAKSLYNLASLNRIAGHPNRALEIFERHDYLDHPTVLYYEACHAALGGRRAQALALLRRVSVIPGFLGKIFSDPNLESLHGDPEFEAIVAEVRVAVEGD